MLFINSRRKATTDISSKVEEDSTDVVLKTAEKTQMQLILFQKHQRKTRKNRRSNHGFSKNIKSKEGTTKLIMLRKRNDNSKIQWENLEYGTRCCDKRQEALDSKAKNLIILMR